MAFSGHITDFTTIFICVYILPNEYLWPVYVQRYACIHISMYMVSP